MNNSQEESKGSDFIETLAQQSLMIFDKKEKQAANRAAHT